MKPTRAEIARAVLTMSKIIPFFPDDDIGQEFVVRAIERFVGTKDRLQWLTDAACDNMKKFSLPELRGIYCSRYEPADGMYTVAETPGFTAAEVEAAAEERYRQREAAEYERKLEEWKQESKRLGYTPAPFLLPAAKMLDAPEVSKEPAQVKQRLQELETKLEEQKAQARKRTAEEQAQLLAELERRVKGA